MAEDFVKVLKVENTQDEFPTEINPEEDVLLAKGLAIETQNNKIVYNSINDSIEIYVNDSKVIDVYSDGTFKVQDEEAGYTESQHSNFNTLVHNIGQNYFLEILRINGLKSQIIYWTDSDKTQKIREKIYTRSGGLIIQIVEKQYDTDGNLKQTLTRILSRPSGLVESETVGLT